MHKPDTICSATHLILMWMASLIGCLMGAEGVDLPPSQAQENGSVLRGKLTYQSDPKHPWRLQRYFVHGPGRHLSEAVVELIPAGKRAHGEQPLRPEPTIHLMDQQDHLFVPEILVLRKGDQVRFMNSESALHNVMCLEAQPPLNHNLAKGQEYLFTPGAVNGTKDPLEITCIFHGAMKAWVFVFDHPYYQLTQREGIFQFDGVQPGDYHLRIAHPAGKLYLETPVRRFAGSHSDWLIELSPAHLKGTENSQKAVEAQGSDDL